MQFLNPMPLKLGLSRSRPLDFILHMTKGLQINSAFFYKNKMGILQADLIEKRNQQWKKKTRKKKHVNIHQKRFQLHKREANQHQTNK